MSSQDRPIDPVPRHVSVGLEAVFRILEALEDARLELREHDVAPGLQDELAPVIRQMHGKLGLDEGGAL